MTSFNRDRSKIFLGNAATWDTAEDLTASNKGFLIHGRVQLSANRGEYTPEDVGFGNFITVVTELNLEVDVTLRCALSYNNMWPQIVANVMGTDMSSPTEVTGGQGDYLHNIDLAEDNFGEFQTLAYLVETDSAVELPGVKWDGFTMQSDVNGVGTFEATGIASRIITPTDTPINTATDINAAAYEGTFAAAPLGAFNAGNHYLRLNAQGGAGLTSGENLGILNYNLSIKRPLIRHPYLDGANSPYTKEPRHDGTIDGQFGFTFNRVDRTVRDWLNDWKAGTELKAELFFDGAQIGTGVNRSYKVQFPRLRPFNLPTNFDLPDKSFAQPQMSYRMMQATAAPTGMTGVTNYMRMAATMTRSVRLLN